MKHHILCVDDEVDNVDALERLFRKKYTVHKATSGKQALKILEENKISLIVTDQRMPGMTGVELLAESMESTPEAIRILLTGYTDIDSVIAAVNSGQIYRYVTKPWDPVDLANAVDKALERYELSAELKDKNARLETALRELRSLDEAKSNFMILINHELKTPLTVILSFMGLLQETNLNDEQKKYLDRISQSADRLQAMISDSLELVSAETGTMPVKITGINLKKLMSELNQTYQAQLDKKGMTLDLAFEASDVRADAKALRSVLTRLLDNAVKFGHEKTSIEFSTRVTDEGHVHVSMSNEGKSLKADTIAKILKPFSLDENIMHHTKGSGLGLSVVQALLHRLGSQLEVQSPKGRFEASFVLTSDR
ncbi:MAG: hybrid sensor histidine kinase/response regulator [Bdellovibrionales bacterium]|nr:hybrid sensor histidine kinase/response regulator [Bdellovibrionales bacterium]